MLVVLLSVPSKSKVVDESPSWLSPGDTETEPVQLDSEEHTEAAPTITSTPLKQGYVRLIQNIPSVVKPQHLTNGIRN